MIRVEIPNEIAEEKPKIIMGLTGRQVVCVGITAFFIFLDFKFLKPYIGDSFCIALALIPASIAALFGWKQVYGMPFEKYLKAVFIDVIVAPNVRKCRTTSFVVVPCDKHFAPIPDSVLPPEVLECVNYVREQTNCGVVSEEDNVDVKKMSQKKKNKYKKSTLAML